MSEPKAATPHDVPDPIDLADTHEWYPYGCPTCGLTSATHWDYQLHYVQRHDPTALTRP